MKLRDVLRQVVIYLDMANDIDIDEGNAHDKGVDKLLLASNNVIREIATCYLPLMKLEHIVVNDNRFDLSSLERQAVRVSSLRSHGISARFKMYPTYMYAQNGDYDIEYSYLPKVIGLDDDVECDVRINEDILANAIVSEYAMMTGDMEKAELFDRRFRENLKNISITKREIRVKGRAFV